MPAAAENRDGLLDWLDAAHHPLDSLDPDAPGADLAALQPIVAEASVIGIGEPVRGVRSASQLRRFVDRMVRFAVDVLDVRALVFEENDLAAGELLDEYVCAGDGSAASALASTWQPWQTAEVLSLIEWLRRRNRRHPDDPVRVGAAIAEDELGLAGHTMAWRERVDGRVVYWGGAAHTAVAPATDTTVPPRSPAGPSDGRRLRQALGSGYLSVGCICDHALSGEPLPPPPSHFAEACLAAVGSSAWFLDLREAVEGDARRWVEEPATTRLIGPQYDPDHDADYSMAGTPFGEWFDAILYVRAVDPVRALR